MVLPDPRTCENRHRVPFDRADRRGFEKSCTLPNFAQRDQAELLSVDEAETRVSLLSIRAMAGPHRRGAALCVGLVLILGAGVGWSMDHTGIHRGIARQVGSCPSCRVPTTTTQHCAPCVGWLMWLCVLMPRRVPVYTCCPGITVSSSYLLLSNMSWSE